MIAFSEDQASALVTDPGTLKRGRALAAPAKWAGLGRTATAAWGECAGSGSQPYRTGIDLTEPAFKCSCPSRVFPCKHGAGLLLLARQPALAPAGAPPAWLAEWLEKRQAKGAGLVAQAGAPPAPTAPTPPDLALGNADTDSSTATAATTAPNAAQPKRDAQRQARMQAGTQELETWLLDLLSAGLAELEKKPPSFWESQAARLVDNQLPGLATALRELAAYPTAGVGRHQRLLARLGELYLLLRTFQNRAALGSAARAEVNQQVGLPLKKDDLLADPATELLTDTWVVLGQFSWDENRLTARRTWLRGQRSARYALVLEYSFGGQAFATPLVLGGRYAGELAFYPGLLALRVAPVALAYAGRVGPAAAPPGLSFEELLRGYAGALARHPWLREWPATLAGALPTPLPDGTWQLHHATEPRTLPLRLPGEEAGWQLLAGSGGRPLTVFGEWNGHTFRLLGSWAGSPPGADNSPAA